jgi:hypothetical protein
MVHVQEVREVGPNVPGAAGTASLNMEVATDRSIGCLGTLL